MLDNKNINENLIEKLKKIQDKFPNLVLSSMGMLDNNKVVYVDSKKYIINKSDVREE